MCKKIIIFLLIVQFYIYSQETSYALRVPIISYNKKEEETIKQCVRKMAYLNRTFAFYSDFRFSEGMSLSDYTRPIAYICSRHSLGKSMDELINELCKDNPHSIRIKLQDFSNALKEIDFIINKADDDTVITTIARNLINHFHGINTQIAIESIIRTEEDSSPFLSTVKTEINTIVEPLRQIPNGIRFLSEDKRMDNINPQVRINL